MNEVSSSDETTDEEDVDRNFEAEAQLIVEIDALPKKTAERSMLVYDTYKKWKQENADALSKTEASNLVVYFKEVILIFGICGATRCEELKNLQVHNVEDHGDKYLVSINETKNDVSRTFLIGSLFYEKFKE